MTCLGTLTLPVKSIWFHGVHFRQVSTEAYVTTMHIETFAQSHQKMVIGTFAHFSH